MRAVLLLTMVVAVLLCPRAARADDTKWVGTPNVIVDASSFALMGAGVTGAAVVTVKSNGDPGGELAPWVLTGGVGALGFVFGSPIVHAARGHLGRAGASLGLRAVGTTLLVASLINLGGGNGVTGVKLGFVFVATAAFFTAVVFDDVVLARDDVPATGTAASALSSSLRARTGYSLAVPF